MPKKTDGWMPLYVADYLADTARLTTEQHGAYLLIIMDYWRNGAPDADDETMAAITRLTVQQWRKHATKITIMFQEVEGKLHHKRIDEERAKAGAVSSGRSEAGKLGAASKWGQPSDEASDKTPGKTRAQRLAEARKKGTHTPDQWEALQFATGYRCVRCGISVDDLEGGALCKDHIKPIYQGGDDSIRNIQPMCRNCNSSKGSDDSDLRETSSPGWQERMEKRLANACQTPAPSPTPITKEKEKPPKPPAAVAAGFDEFWSIWPRRVGKAGAEKAWSKLRPDDAMQARIRSAVQAQSQTPDWRKDGGQFIPHPATWLNGRRWEDEIVMQTAQDRWSGVVL